MDNTPTSSINEFQNSMQTTSVGSTSAPDPTTAGSAAQANSQGIDMNTTVSNANELRTKAPEVWRAMLQGIAMNICNQMKEKNDELKRMMRESERALRGG